MKHWKLYLRAIIFGMIVIAIMGAVSGLLTVRDDLRELRTTASEDLLWTSSQLEKEYWRLRNAVLAHQVAPTSKTAQEIGQRFDIFWSRVNVFKSGAPKNRLQSIEAAAQVIKRLREKLVDLEPIIGSITASNSEPVQKLLVVLQQCETDIHFINRNFLRDGQETSARLRSSLIDQSALLTASSIGAAVLSILLLILYAIENRRQIRNAQKSHLLFEQAEKAREAKSNFLSMMSHELRTPMNGVLGMIALSKEEAASPQQEVFLNEAGNSARRMNLTLSSVLDLSDLEDDTAQLSLSEVTIEELATTLRQSLVDDSAQKQKFQVSTKDGAAKVRADKDRIISALLHLCDCLSEVSNGGLIHFFLRVVDQQIVATLGVAPLEPEVQLWNVPDTEIANDLSLLVASGLIKKMNGFVQGNLPLKSGEPILQVQLPANSTVHSVVVAYDFQTKTEEQICHAAFSDKSIEQYSDHEPNRVQLLVVGAGTPDERERIRKHRTTFSNAMIVGVGQTQNDMLFDNLLPFPVPAEDVAKIVMVLIASQKV